ncbi:hypothetical protein RAL73_003321 [Vibrio cholerae]|nr:hypothetical protein [Vibrio cholerae]EJL6693533.1 hypothetical protein [Vibrio cholerae]ELG4677714.1 hypothetical protein [Vibrio cholerae]
MPIFNLKNNTGSKVRFYIGPNGAERNDLTRVINIGETLKDLEYSKGDYLACGIQRNPNKPYVDEIFYNDQINGNVTLQSPHGTADFEKFNAVTQIQNTTTYTIDFENKTNETWTFCVYQTLPESPGLDSVSWKQTTIPKSGISGVEWDINYLVALASYKQKGGKGVYHASQSLATELGKKWEAIFDDGVQQLIESGDTTAGQLLIENKSDHLANFGIGMDGDIALVKKNVYSGNSAQFSVKPTYWVAIYKDLTQGEVISGNQIHGPLKVTFEGGQTDKKFIAKIQGNRFIFEEVGTDNSMSILYSQAVERLSNSLVTED